jgi:hypothetical protein
MEMIIGSIDSCLSVEIWVDFTFLKVTKLLAKNPSNKPIRITSKKIDESG